MSSKPQSTEDGHVLLQARNLRFTYPGGTRASPFQLVVDQIDVRAGEVLALCGPSGSGKSTLLAVLAGLLRPSAGHVLVETSKGERDLYACTRSEWRSQRREFGFVFQDPRESLNDRRSVLEIVIDPLRIHGLPTASEVADQDNICRRLANWLPPATWSMRRAHEAAAFEILNKVGIKPDQAHRTPQRLSGGQRQRVAIARALITHPRMLFLDEPTSALDVSVQASVATLLKDLHQQDRKLGYVLVTHDLALARQLADRIAVLDEGRLVELGHVDQVLQSPTSPVTRRLLEIARSELSNLAESDV